MKKAEFVVAIGAEIIDRNKQIDEFKTLRKDESIGFESKVAMQERMRFMLGEVKAFNKVLELLQY